MTRLDAACHAAGIPLPQLRWWLARLGLPPPERMDRPTRVGLLLIVESWRRH